MPLRFAEEVKQRARELSVRRKAILVRRADTRMNLVRGIARFHVSLSGYRLGKVNARRRGASGIELP